MKFLNHSASKLALAAGVAMLIAGGAYAQAANGTPAGEVVENGFTLNYTVGGSTQPTITNDADGQRTTFVVDRLVDLTLAVNTTGLDPNDRKTVASGSQAETFVYTITNDGNDIQSYSFNLVNAAGDPADGFESLGSDYTITYTVEGVGGGARSAGVDLDNGGTTDVDSCEGTSVSGTIEQFTTAGGAVSDAVTDDEGGNPNSADITCPILPDERIILTITRDVPTGMDIGDIDDFVLVAETREPFAWLNEGGTYDLDSGSGPVATAIGGETDATIGSAMTANAVNTATGIQNVFLDNDNGAEDGPSDGISSTTNGFIIVNPALTGSKEAWILATELAGSGAGSTCDENATTGFTPASLTAAPTSTFPLPGACVAYIIEVENVSVPSRDATGISISDTIPAEVEYQSHVFDNFSNTPTNTTACTVGDDSCLVGLSSGNLDAGETARLIIYTTLK